MFLTSDKNGNIYFSDGPVIRRLAPDGTVSLVAGTGTPSLQVGTGDGGPAVSATLGNIVGLTVDSKGEVYLVESAQFRARIRRIDVNGTITGVAGIGTGNGSDTGAPLETILTTVASPMIDDQGVLWFTSNVSLGRILQLKDGLIRVVGGASPKHAP